jgi:sulfatase modifying factor 1
MSRFAAASLKRNRAVVYSVIETSFGTIVESHTMIGVVRPIFLICALSPVCCAQQAPVKVDQLPEPEKRWAIVIGVNEYRDPGFSANLGAVNDAKAIADSLINYAGFPEDNVVVLTTDPASSGGQPTRTAILKSLTALDRRLTEGLLLFAFSGHGMEVDNEAYLLPSDAVDSPGNSQLLRDTAIGVPLLEKYLLATRSPQIVVLLDACRNAPVEAGKGEQTQMGTPYKVTFNIENREVTAFATLYAADRGQRSYEDKARQQGYFSEVFVDALEGREKQAANGTGDITLATLSRYLQVMVPERVSKAYPGKKQTPIIEVKGFKPEDLVIAHLRPEVPPGTSDNVVSQNSRDGLMYVLIAGGDLQMGCVGPSDRDCRSDEKPSHHETVAPFRIGQTEVTVSAYWRFTESLKWGKGMPPPPHSFNVDWNDGSQPIVNITWEEALSYCQWAGGSLPTEAQWEYAARGGQEAAVFPWGSGNLAPHELANYGADKCCGGFAPRSSRDQFEYAAPVAQFRSNAFGLYDMAGNVAEWVNDLYQLQGAASAAETVELRRTVKGGSWKSPLSELRISGKLAMNPNKYSADIGFRCVLPK